jgi:1-phosphofructokinase family hexose kinase
VAGGLAGRLLKELISRLDIPFSEVLIEGDTRINTIITDLKDHTQTRISAPGPKISSAHLSQFFKTLLNCRPKPFLWALGGSLPAGTPSSTYRDLVRALQKSGVPCVLDADDEPLKAGLEARPFMIKPNEYEMERLMGRKFRTLDDYLGGARELVRKGVQLVVVSLGAQGALFATTKESFHVPALRVPVKSKVGAGDSLIGGLLVGLSRKLTLKEAARLGVAASASAVMRESPRLCLRSDIDSLYKKIRVRPL